MGELYGFRQWSEVIQHIETEQLSFDDGNITLSTTQLVDDIHVIAQWVPETYLQNEKMLHQGIALWIHQLSYSRKGTNYMVVPVLHTLANAIKLVAPLSGSKALLQSLHTDNGMLLQLKATYFIGKHIPVIGVERERGRVDIAAEVKDTVLNIHVKNTHPFTKETAQFQAIAFINQALMDNPITNPANEQLVVVKLDGYVATDIPIDYWKQLVSTIQPQSGVQQFNIADPRDPIAPSSVTLELAWQQPNTQINSTLSGVNPFHNIDSKVSDICKRIPEAHPNIEIALLLNHLASSFQMNRAYFEYSKLDGVILLHIAQGTEGLIYKRSTIYLRPSLARLEQDLNSLLPEHVSLL